MCEYKSSLFLFQLVWRQLEFAFFGALASAGALFISPIIIYSEKGKKMKKIISLLLFMVLVFSTLSLVSCSISDAIDLISTHNGIVYRKLDSGEYAVHKVNLNQSSGGITVYDGEGNIEERYYRIKGSGNVVIPTTFRNKPVTRIDNYAFQNCLLYSIVIPDSVTYIGKGAFKGCKYLKNVVIGDGVRIINSSTFQDCKTLSNVSLGKSISTIGENSFKNCIALYNLELPNSVTQIDANAFNGCTSLENLDLGKSVKTIGNSAFSGCKALKIVVIPNSTKEIGASAFKGCTSLKGVLIGASVTTISDSTFENCTLLEEVVLGPSVTRINKYAFKGCTAICEIDIPSSILSIDSYAFSGCTSITDVYFENTTGWIVNSKNIPSTTLEDSETAAKFFVETIGIYSWTRNK